MVEETDVVIVGARCAGCAAAVPLRRSGHRVVMLDRGRFPSDQLSTHVLVPNGAPNTSVWGPWSGSSGWTRPGSATSTSRTATWSSGSATRPSTGSTTASASPGTSRTSNSSARDAGAEVRERCAVEQVVWRGGRAAGVVYRAPDGRERELQAKLVIGADGRRSRIAAEVGAWQPYRGSRNGRGFAFRYMDDPLAGTAATDAYGIYRAARTVALTLPSTPQGRLLVVWMCPAEDVSDFRADPEGAWQAKLAENPAVAARIAGAANQSKIRSTADLCAYYRRSSGPGWALAGDAGHFKDPVTGNGMRDAMRHGRLLGEAAAARLHDAVGLDRAIRDWERRRDLDMLSTYHWGNRESRPLAVNDLVREVLRTFAATEDPDLSAPSYRPASTPAPVRLPVAA